ncbi:MAG: TatD family hydrolase [Acutalibacteraceae bacterium]
MIIDTHAHYDDERFDDNLADILSEMKQNGVEKIITCAVNYDNAEKVLELCDKYEMLYAAVGIYPHETSGQNWDRDRLERLAGHKKAVAIGEIGLDYYYDDSSRETQLDIVKKQISLANELGLPITYHDREAHADTMEILKEYKPKGVIHCFSGSVEMAKEIIKLGMYLGIGGALTFKNARVLPNVVKEIPLSKLVLETDAPYMTPVPFRGKCNRSDYIIYIAEKIAEIKGVSVSEVLKVTSENAVKIFEF